MPYVYIVRPIRIDMQNAFNTCYTHVEDGANSGCSGRRASGVAPEGRLAGSFAIGVPAARTAPQLDHTDHGRMAGAGAQPASYGAKCGPGGRHSRGARPALMVLDASALLAVLLDLDAGAIRARVRQEEAQAPHLVDVEVTQALRRWHRAGQLDDSRAATTLQSLGEMPLTRYPHAPLLPRVWQLRHRLTAYDAIYLALAESLECRLLTRDQGLASVARASVAVEVV